MIIPYNNEKSNKSTTRRPSFLVVLLLLSFFMSQFYIWKSGLPQFSHIFIILAFLTFIVKGRIIDISSTKLLSVFILYVILVNLIWFFINGFDSEYLKSTLYWLFNLLIFILLMNLKNTSVDTFFEYVLKIIFFSYLLEISIWLVGFGRYDYFPRYNGFFNDPNQMAFWVLSTCSIYLYISKKKIKNLIVFSLAIFLLLLTLSRSALLGVPFLAIALVAKQKGNVANRLLLTILSLIGLMIVGMFFYSRGVFNDIITRLIDGIDEKDSQIEGRGFDVLLSYPEHLFFGAGQGGYAIYHPIGNEIHSTWFGIIFYYGSFGLALFLGFLYQIFKKLSFADKILFLGPMFYGFTTYSARTTIFWFVVCIFLMSNKKENKV